MASQQSLASQTWRRAPCLAACGALVKRHRHAWIELGGTLDGRWLTAYSVDPGQAFADQLPAPAEVYLLGVVHRECLQSGVRMLRAGTASLGSDLATLLIEVEPDPRSGPVLGNLSEPPRRDQCPFCQQLGPNSKLTDEDIYPEWLLRELRSRGARMRRGDELTEKIYRTTTSVCGDCNNGWMSTIENDIKELVLDLVDHTRELNEGEQRRLALWATVKAVLFDARLGEPRTIPHGTSQEVNVRREPSRGVCVWIAAYEEGKDSLPVNRRPIYTAGATTDGAPDPDQIIGICVTFVIVRIAFQVFIPFVQGSLAPLENFNGSVLQIHPLQTGALTWPPRYRFHGESFPALAQRMYDGQEPVSMPVTLHATQISRS